jgi:hypothetical protein
LIVTQLAEANESVLTFPEVRRPSSTLQEKLSQFPVKPFALRAAWQDEVSRVSMAHPETAVPAVVFSSIVRVTPVLPVVVPPVAPVLVPPVVPVVVPVVAPVLVPEVVPEPVVEDVLEVCLQLAMSRARQAENVAMHWRICQRRTPLSFLKS